MSLEGTGVPRDRFGFEARPQTDQSFENALVKARAGDRLSVADGVELLTTGTDADGIDRRRKELVLEAADRRRAEVVGEEVTFVANLNNNVTTACNTGCLFCNFKDRADDFERGSGGNEGGRDGEEGGRDGEEGGRDGEEGGRDGEEGGRGGEEGGRGGDHDGFTRTPTESREAVRDAIGRGAYEVCSVSGLHPAFALDDEHRAILEASDRGDLNYKPPDAYGTDPGTYAEQIGAMSVGGAHVHSVTPEEAYHARRGTDWSYEEVYGRLEAAGLDSVPGTAAEILVDEVRQVICPGKIDTEEWLDAMTAAANVGLATTATIMYGHVENEMHRALHLERVRELQDRTGAITEFVPLSFVHRETPLYERGMVEGGATTDEDELMVAVSRLFLDNIEHIQSSWVKFGNELGLKMLSCGADDFMGTILSEEITKRAGGEHGQYRSVQEYVEMISAIGRVPVERSTDYTERRRIDPDDPPFGPVLGPKADGTPML